MQGYVSLHLPVCVSFRVEEREREKKKKRTAWSAVVRATSNVIELGKKTVENHRWKDDTASDSSPDVTVELCRLIGN